jgi:hypothetical protein
MYRAAWADLLLISVCFAASRAAAILGATRTQITVTTSSGRFICPPVSFHFHLF